MVNFVKIRIIRTLIITFSFLLSAAVFGQSLYQPCQMKGDTYYQESFDVKVTMTSYGPQFDSFDPCLTSTLKKGIKRFIENTQYKEYRKNGKHIIYVVKKTDKYYVVERERPLSLYKL